MTLEVYLSQKIGNAAPTPWLREPRSVAAYIEVWRRMAADGQYGDSDFVLLCADQLEALIRARPDLANLDA